MVRESQKQLPAIEIGDTMSMLQYLIDMGIRGNHLLFEPETIRRAFNRNLDDLAEIDPETVKEVNLAIKRIIELRDIEEKRFFISELDPLLQDVIIHLYFQMIDRTMVHGSPVRH